MSGTAKVADRSLRPRRRAPFDLSPPLTMTWAEAAASVARATESWLRDHIGDLPDFPRPDPVMDVFCRAEIEAWVRRRFGIVSPVTATEDAEDILIGRVNGKAARKIPGQPAA